MKLVNFFYRYYKFKITIVVLLGLLSAYLDALAISLLLNSEDLTKAVGYILIASVLRLFFIYRQASLGSIITTDLGINIIKDYHETFNIKNSDKIELSGLVLLKAVNFNNYVIRPVLSLFINGISVLLLIFPIIYTYINYSTYALIPLAFLYLFYSLWFKNHLKNLSKGLSLDQDMSGLFVSSLQSNSLSESNNLVISKLAMHTYRSLQRRTAKIYFLSQSPRSWFELALVVIAILIYLFASQISFNMSVLGGLSYTFYRIMTPLNSVIQAVVSMKSFNESSIEVMDYAMSTNYTSGYLKNRSNNVEIEVDKDLSFWLKQSSKREMMFLEAIRMIENETEGNFSIKGLNI